MRQKGTLGFFSGGEFQFSDRVSGTAQVGEAHLGIFAR
jgi:hypothetical protein